MKYIKQLFKEHSAYLIFLSLANIILSILFILTFVYQDKMDTALLQQYPIIDEIPLLIQNLYSQTWWGFVLFAIGLIAITTLTSLIYNKLEYLFISICTWVLLTILAININGTIADSFGVAVMFVPIIAIHIIVYRAEVRKKKLIEETSKKKSKK